MGMGHSIPLVETLTRKSCKVAKEACERAKQSIEETVVAVGREGEGEERTAAMAEMESRSRSRLELEDRVQVTLWPHLW
jgi:hypothetical protein